MHIHTNTNNHLFKDSFNKTMLNSWYNIILDLKLTNYLNLIFISKTHMSLYVFIFKIYDLLYNRIKMKIVYNEDTPTNSSFRS